MFTNSPGKARFELAADQHQQVDPDDITVAVSDKFGGLSQARGTRDGRKPGADLKVLDDMMKERSVRADKEKARQPNGHPP